MKNVFVLLTILFSGCSSINHGSPPKQGKRTFGYIDVSGKWSYVREHKIINKKLVTRTTVNQSHGSVAKPLEKSVVVSQIGTVKGGRSGRSTTVRPFASDYSIWLEGKEYSTKLRLDPKNKSMVVNLASPEAKWQGESRIAFPKAQQFCFFSQLPECLFHNHMLTRAKERPGKPLPFYVVWDGYPYTQEQLGGVGSTLFSSATLTFDEMKKGLSQYQMEVDGQTLLYQFSKSNDLVRMFWIAQGISIVPPGEEAQDEVE